MSKNTEAAGVLAELVVPSDDGNFFGSLTHGIARHSCGTACIDKQATLSANFGGQMQTN